MCARQAGPVVTSPLVPAIGSEKLPHPMTALLGAGGGEALNTFCPAAGLFGAVNYYAFAISKVSRLKGFADGLRVQGNGEGKRFPWLGAPGAVVSGLT